MIRAAIMLRSGINIKPGIKKTLHLLRLNKVNHCVLVPSDKIYDGMLMKIKDVIRYQTCFDIPIVTLFVVNSKVKDEEDFSEQMDALGDFFRMLARNNLVFNNKVKVSIFGKWYDLPSRVVEPIKKVIEETKDYDSFFLNLCINYDGQ